MSTRLVRILSRTVRQQRESRALTQRQLAELAGFSQATVARIERGDRTPTLPVLENLLAAMGGQLTVAVEPLDAHLDAELAALAGRPLADRIERLNLDQLLDRLGDLPNAITGATAALLQGAPLPVDAPELAIRWRDSARLTRWLEKAYGQRWNARWKEFGGPHLEPEEPGEHRWRTPLRRDPRGHVRRAAGDRRGPARWPELPGGAPGAAGRDRSPHGGAPAPLPRRAAAPAHRPPPGVTGQPADRSQSTVGRPASARALLAALNGRLPRKPRGFIGLG
ncbi:helix-turn-helix domain-containing protein [Micromonospora musae]|uniref:helix-turn-helix domain-containing protein n=1 Tax=Micromonospora musae TaxID=1894970 RepID=UPI001F322E76|nr:helix-turn-helix transcriptional regulator [Micromonospora musae]